ncbi:DUF885 domain-containing protein [Brevundimonas sp.]|uniref:DUF885 domain-containing protein n=1 Tax=Brevundimonas sp. TaxID=1871086 RepID=UPI003D6D5A81
MTIRRLLLTLSSVSLVALTASGVPAMAASPSSGATAPEVAADADAAEVAARFKALYEADWAFLRGEDGSDPDGEGGWREASRLPRVDAASQQARVEHAVKTLAALEALPLARLSDEDRVNAAVLKTNLESVLIDGRAREWEAPFNSDSNFWTYLDRSGGLLSADDYRAYLGRMRDMPRFFDEQIVNMRAGLDRGFTPPRVTVEGRESSISAFITDDAESNAFYRAFVQMPATMPVEEQARLRAEARDVVLNAVVPAYRRLLAFYTQDYLPRARVSLAASDLPNGQAFYADQIRKYTTLNLTADQIHEIGLSEVARIEAEMQGVMRETGFKGTLPEFVNFLRTDPQFYARTPDELLMVSAWTAKRVDGKLGEVLGRLPRRRFAIIPVPDALAPFYTAGRGGLQACQMNTYDLPSRPLYNIPALTLHECAPGHSLQAALAEEREGVPDFRRHTYFSGYGEGWGLYTEWLGVEMGIYRTPYENFGRLSYEMWRAARLVIDAGIHQKGWSREQAQAYLADHTALSRREVETEVDRYISWPGQALSYKLGELTIRRLRGEAEAALGPKFDLRRFHDAILDLGSVPLPTLEERIVAFIAEEGRAPQEGGGAAKASSSL